MFDIKEEDFKRAKGGNMGFLRKTNKSFEDELRLMSDRKLKKLLLSGTLSVAKGAMAGKELNRRGYKNVGEIK